MINTQVSALLDKYFDGSSTLEEESSLKEYFNGSYDAAFQEYADLFQLLKMEASVSTSYELPQDLEYAVINGLLEKYWDCNSSLEDEAYLKEYFNGNAVHPELSMYKDLFEVFSAEAKIVNGNLKKDTQSIPSTAKKSSTSAKVFSLSKKWMAVAASLLIGMMFWINVDRMDNTQADGQVILANLSVEEREAYEVTVEALAFLSGKLDKSSNSIGSDFKKMANADIFK